MYGPKRQALALAGIAGVDGDMLTLRLKPTNAFTAPAVGQHCRLDARFTGFNSAKVTAQLRNLDTTQRSWFARLVASPSTTRTALDTVLVSYGVSDVEYALGEKEFIFSRNRLNVAITRARVKTVVFLSRALLEPPIQALDDGEVAEGIAFMQGLARHCELNGEHHRIDVGGTGRVTVLRA